MKYKVGDKVKVREDLVEYTSYDDMFFIEPMDKFLGKTVEIESILPISYKIKECEHPWFTDEMFEGLVNEHDWKVVIIPDGDKTEAKLYKDGSVEKSVTVNRYHEDEYSIEGACKALMEKMFPEPKSTTKIVKCDKYEVGDKVKFRDDMSVFESYGLTIWPGMDDMIGKTAIIEDVCDKSYGQLVFIEDNIFIYHSDMLEGKVVETSEKVEEKKVPEPLFKVGDIVKMIECDECIPIGAMGVVVDADEHSIPRMPFVDFKFPYAGCHTGCGRLTECTGRYVSEKRLKKVDC